MKNLYRRDSFRDYFPMPNEIFSLGLSCGEIAVYAYLMRCEERETFQCHPSYRTIGGALHMSENTVRKYVASLERCGLICTEPTQIITKSGLKRNGSLRYSILPIQNAVDLFHSRQMEQLEIAAARQQVVEKADGRTARMSILLTPLPKPEVTSDFIQLRVAIARNLWYLYVLKKELI